MIKLNHFKSLNKSTPQQIEKLTHELDVVKTKKETNIYDVFIQNKIKCDLCEDTASTSTALKCHVTVKHKKIVQSGKFPMTLKFELCDTICISQHALKGYSESENAPKLSKNLSGKLTIFIFVIPISMKL